MAASPTIAQFGSWQSPIASEAIAAGVKSINDVWLDGDAVYWTERRPTEAGRFVVMRRSSDGAIAELTPPGFNARTRVHEYGGAALGAHGGAVYFANYDDQRLHRQAAGEAPTPITIADVDYRFADFAFDPARGRLIAVREDHSVVGREAVNTLVTLNLDGNRGGGEIIASGYDFYSNPRVSPDGAQLAYLAWNHPNMPWDGTDLRLADIAANGELTNDCVIAGGVKESIFQPEWAPDGALYFVSDRTNWWNLYRWRAGKTTPVCQRESEFGQPLWSLGAATYGVASADRLICAYSEGGVGRLGALDPETGHLAAYDLPYTSFALVRVGAGVAACLAGSPTRAQELVRLDLATGRHEVLAKTVPFDIDAGYISVPTAIEFPTERGLTAHAFYYAPANRDFAAPTGERPPLLVMCHGGPTSATNNVLSPRVQFWTSRGIAVLDVNYGGSTGYGRAYRDRLNEQWGIVDVEDCVNGALYLVKQGLVDGDRLLMTGGSAGGYTTLCILTFRTEFRTGASHFGISDLEAMVKETHKFESRYIANLVAPYPARRDVYVERSAIHHLDRINRPMILFQGLEDLVVPPNQSEMIYDAVKAKGLPVAYVAFPGEQHGFRQAKNIKRAFDGELYFYSRVLGFPLADHIDPVEIDNLA